MSEIETDYLVVGAGAAGMAFTDEILRHSDASVTIVDRRPAPGGHWIDAYPHVRLHQPSTFYGVSSVPLGHDALDTVGTNAGFYEVAGADELRAYYSRVMDRHFLPSGRVRYFPCSEFLGDGRFSSRLDGRSHGVKINRKLVDTTYLEGSIPATSPPPFEVAPGVRCIPAGEITRITEAPERFVIIGAGKTALDTCVWLLEQGVSPSAIRWVKPREAWWVNRKFHQPHGQLPEFYRGVALQVEAMAQASSLDDLFARLEHDGFFLRVDQSIMPTMFRGAIVSEAEIDLLRRIEDVVRLGHVQKIEADTIVLDDGRVETSPNTLHIHCASRGIARRPVRPIFEGDRITVQLISWGLSCYQFATIGVVEATVEDDAAKNRLCPPVQYWDTSADFLQAFAAGAMGERVRGQHAAVGPWMKATRLNPGNSVAPERKDPLSIAARERLKRAGPDAFGNIMKLLAPS